MPTCLLGWLLCVVWPLLWLPAMMSPPRQHLSSIAFNVGPSVGDRRASIVSLPPYPSLSPSSCAIITFDLPNLYYSWLLSGNRVGSSSTLSLGRLGSNCLHHLCPPILFARAATTSAVVSKQSLSYSSLLSLSWPPSTPLSSSTRCHHLPLRHNLFLLLFIWLIVGWLLCWTDELNMLLSSSLSRRLSSLLLFLSLSLHAPLLPTGGAEGGDMCRRKSMVLGGNHNHGGVITTSSPWVEGPAELAQENDCHRCLRWPRRCHFFFRKQPLIDKIENWRSSHHVESDSTWGDECRVERSPSKSSALHLEVWQDWQSYCYPSCQKVGSFSLLLCPFFCQIMIIEKISFHQNKKWREH